MTDRGTPAVVLGAGINGLGVVRSLARAKVSVWLLDTDERQPEMHTRAAKPVRVHALDGETLIEDLERLGKEPFGDLRPVLFLTREATVKTVSQYRDRLARFYRFTLPPVDMVTALQHKSGFQRLAEQHGAPIPRLMHITAPGDLNALRDLQFPVVVKPGVRNAAYGRQFSKAYRIESIGDARDLIDRILPVMSDVVIQEWIEGPDSSIHFCLQYTDHRGKTVASFTGRKLRSWPPAVGGTASCTTAPEAHAELSAITTRFFKDTGVTGMASMEYKRDARTGAFRMVEPTIGRTDYQEEVATLNGTNIPYAAYCSELGLPIPGTTTPAQPVVWRVDSEDSQSAEAQKQRIADAWPSGSHVVDALWRWNDPMPVASHIMQRVQRRLRRASSRSTLNPRTAGSKP